MFHILYPNIVLICFVVYLTLAAVLLVDILVFVDCLPTELKCHQDKAYRGVLSTEPYTSEGLRNIGYVNE